MIKNIYTKPFAGMRIAFLVLMLMSFGMMRAQDYSSLYMIGSATAGNWDLASATRLTPVSGSEGVFTWEGHLKKDEFKFISNTDWYWPGFVATAANTTVENGGTYSLRYFADMNEVGDNDYKFVPAAEGDYKITVDLKALTMKVEAGAAQTVPTELWLEGSAVPQGVQKLTAGANGMFSYKGKLSKGTLRLMTTAAAGDGTIYYVPFWENPDVQDGSPLVKTDDATAQDFYVEVPSDYYRIDINLLSLNMSAATFRAPYTLFAVGGAVESGWNTQDAVPFVQDLDNPYLYTCTTELKVRNENVEPNLFKILGQPDWGPYSLHPTIAEQPVTEATGFVENGDDTKWSVPSDKQGMYTLTVDLWKGTFKGEYLSNETASKGTETTDIASASAKKNVFGVYANGNTVIIDSKESLNNARLVSMNGGVVAASGKTGNRIEFQGNLLSGVYVVAAETADGHTHVKKIAVSK